MVIVGNKCDLNDRRIVPQQNGEKVSSLVMQHRLADPGSSNSNKLHVQDILQFVFVCLVLANQQFLYDILLMGVVIAFLYNTQLAKRPFHLISLQLAKRHRQPYVETSVKTGTNVKATFYKLAESLIHNHNIFQPGQEVRIHVCHAEITS